MNDSPDFWAEMEAQLQQVESLPLTPPHPSLMGFEPAQGSTYDLNARLTQIEQALKMVHLALSATVLILSGVFVTSILILSTQ